MDKLTSRYLSVFAVSIGILALLYFCADPISLNNTGVAYQIEQVVKSIIIVLMGWIFSRFITIAFLKPMEKRRGKAAHQVIINFFTLLVMLCVSIFVIVVIYGQSMGWIATTMFSALGILAYIEKDVVNDCVAGIMLDFKKAFDVGDWIQYGDGKLAKVVKMGILDTEAITIDDVSVSIGNNTLASSILINYSKPNPNYWIEISLSLGDDISIERAKRLLLSAAMFADGVVDQKVVIFASAANDRSVTYDIKFKVESFENHRDTRHNVISAVMAKLEQYDIHIAESGGTYKIIQAPEPPAPLETPATTTALDMIRLTCLFDECSAQEKEEIAEFLQLREYNPGDVIIEEKSISSSMFFVAEGVVDVSETIKTDDGESRNHIYYISTDSFLGEDGVLRGSPRRTRASSFSKTVLYELEKEHLKEIVKKHPHILEKMTDMIVRKAHERAMKENQVKLDHKAHEKEKHEFLATVKSFLEI
ncbi:MAG: mechanosensitive ion channel family protein [Holosporales bacterium]|jgi:small-conductance mechanosensitive channel/CRP-like cAMP-binding protein|nr:mechanosensitive ion channel family protein [Holosporales bacterium]